MTNVEASSDGNTSLVRSGGATRNTGLRWGEATGLRVRHIDRAGRRVSVEENAVNVNGTVIVGTPKTHERRSVVYPAFLDDAIEVALGNRP